VITDAALADELSRRTLELCRIPSVIGHEGPLADHVERWARTTLD
jgi:succinyl-diaminopimelate desuccinylase